MCVKTKHALTIRVAAILAGVALLISGNAASETLTIDEALQSTPVSLETHGSKFLDMQEIMDIPFNLQMMYGVHCVLEMNIIEKDRPERYPSRNYDFVPLKCKPDTTLREFLDVLCSDGKMMWSVIHNAIHIRPTTTPSNEIVLIDNLNVSLDLTDVSVLDAIKAWALDVNKKRTPQSRGLKIMHPYKLPGTSGDYHVTPANLTRKGAVTLKIENVTAREALCAIQGASKEWVKITYCPSVRSWDMVNLSASVTEMEQCPEITEEEWTLLRAEEDLDAVYVGPEVKSAPQE